MKTYILRRLLLAIPTLLIITFITMSITALAPGDPVSQLTAGMQEGLNKEALAQDDKGLKAFREQFRLDKPLLTRWALWIRDIVIYQDFGKSITTKQPVLERIETALPVTIRFNVVAIVFIYLISIPLGIFSAVKRDTISDKILTVILFALYSLPSFWVATILQMYFCGGEYLNLFPLQGLWVENFDSLPYTEALFSSARYWVLPLFCATYGGFASLSRFQRVGLLDELKSDYIRTARAKGLSERVVVLKHALRNSLIPMVTIIAGLLPGLISGSLILEVIFGIPGMGRLGYAAVLARDYNTIMAINFFAASLTLIGILISDILYAIVDPRITYS